MKHVLAFENDTTDPHKVRLRGEPIDAAPHESELREAQTKVLEFLTKSVGLWWSVDQLVTAIDREWVKFPGVRWDLLPDVVGCVLYAMAVEGRIITKRKNADQVTLFAAESIENAYPDGVPSEASDIAD